MALLTNIKQKLFNRRWAEEKVKLRQTTPAALNLHSANRITLLFPADDADERKVIDKWRDGHKKAGRKIRVLGYFAQDIGATNFNFRALSIKDLNWYGIPEGSLVEEFQKESCEILIRLGPQEHPILDYLADMKPGALKVGPYHPTKELPYHLQYDASRSTKFKDQLAAIEHIFSYTNATATT